MYLVFRLAGQRCHPFLELYQLQEVDRRTIQVPVSESANLLQVSSCGLRAGPPDMAPCS